MRPTQLTHHLSSSCYSVTVLHTISSCYTRCTCVQFHGCTFEQPRNRAEAHSKYPIMFLKVHMPVLESGELEQLAKSLECSYWHSDTTILPHPGCICLTLLNRFIWLLLLSWQNSIRNFWCYVTNGHACSCLSFTKSWNGVLILCHSSFQNSKFQTVSLEFYDTDFASKLLIFWKVAWVGSCLLLKLKCQSVGMWVTLEKVRSSPWRTNSLQNNP